MAGEWFLENSDFYPADIEENLSKFLEKKMASSTIPIMCYFMAKVSINGVKKVKRPIIYMTLSPTLY
jgi:hypothetical protein